MNLAFRLVLALVATALLLEVGVRVLGLVPPVYRDRQVEPRGYSPFGRSSTGLLTYKPNASWEFLYDPAGDPRGYLGPEGRVSFRINSLGLRGPERPLHKPAGTQQAPRGLQRRAVARAEPGYVAVTVAASRTWAP